MTQDSDGVAVHHTVRCVGPDGVMRRAWATGIGAFIGFILAVEISFRAFGIRPAPIHILLPPAVLGALAGFFLPLPRRWNILEIAGGQLLLRYARATTLISAPSVSLVAADPGLSFDGGELIVWKRTRIITPDGRYILTLNPEDHPAAYEEILSVCRNAIGISLRGEAHLPPLALSSAQTLAACRQTVAAEFRFQAVRALLAAGVTGALSIALVAGSIYLFKSELSDDRDSAIGLVIHAVVFACASVFFVVRFFRIAAQRGTVIRAIAQLNTGGDPVGSGEALHHIRVNPAPPDPLDGPPPSTLKRRSIHALCLCWIPFIGLAFAFVTLLKARRHGGWPALLAGVAMIPGTLITAISAGVLLSILNLW